MIQYYAAGLQSKDTDGGDRLAVLQPEIIQKFLNFCLLYFP